VMKLPRRSWPLGPTRSSLVGVRPGFHEGRESLHEALQRDHPFRQGWAVSVEPGK
jgi:hypothetical protein